MMKILFIVFVWPEPTSSAAGFRILQLIEALRTAGHAVSVSSPCQSNPFREALTQQGITTSVIAPNDPAFDSFIRELDPDIVVFDRFMIEEQFGWRVQEQCPDAVRILDTCDLHSLRRTRQRKVARGENALELSASDFCNDDAYREVAAIYRSDLSLVVSDFERRLLVAQFGIPEELLHLCRFFYPLPGAPPEFNARAHFVVIGNFNHPPNLDSVTLLRDFLWDMIRDQLTARGLPHVELHVYGSYPPEAVLKHDDPKRGFRVKGWTESAQSTLAQYRINLAPLRFGAGIKGKISDGWAVGTPCIATSIAAEGMTEGFDFGGEVHDNWNDFAASAADLYSSQDRWRTAQERGITIVQKLYDASSGALQLNKVFKHVVANREERRRANFIGAMLRHHTLRSTEYLSRWIEVKNQLREGASLKQNPP